MTVMSAWLINVTDKNDAWWKPEIKDNNVYLLQCIMTICLSQLTINKPSL
jgi:hypothetical protein